MINQFLFYQRLFNPRRKPSLPFTLSVQLQKLINPVDSFVIPRFTRSPDVSKKLTEAVGWMLKSQILQCLNYFCIVLLRLVVIHGSRQRGELTGPANRNVVILNNGLRQFPLLAGPQPFFVMTSFKMA